MDRRTIFANATKVFRRTVSCSSDGDEVNVDSRRDGLCLVYTSVQASHGARDVTRLRCLLDFESGQMWVDDLRVASRLRSKGIGRQLVAAAETIAGDLGLRTLNAFPLIAARRFWTKMGYTSHPKTARVVKKDL